MAYRSTELAARERIDHLEEELLEAEAELERHAEQLEAAERHRLEQIRMQRVEQTQETRAVNLEEPELSRRTLAALALLAGTIVGALVATVVILSVITPAEPMSAEARWSAFAEAMTQRSADTAKLGTLKIHCSPACESITIDRRVVGASPLSIELLPGTHRVTCRAKSIIKTIIVQIVSGQVTSQSILMK